MLVSGVRAQADGRLQYPDGATREPNGDMKLADGRHCLSHHCLSLQLPPPHLNHHHHHHHHIGSVPVPWGEDEEELDELGEGLPLPDGSGAYSFFVYRSSIFSRFL
jgi:hypothetical protein